MTLQVSNLSSALSSGIKNLDFSNLNKATDEAVNNFDALKKSTLAFVGEIKGGIESLTSEIDNLEDTQSPQLSINIGRVTAAVPGLGSKLTKPVSAASDILKLTGSTASTLDGSLNDIITSTTPEAVANALQSTVGATTRELSGALRSLASIDLQDVVISAINGNNPWDAFTQSARVFTKSLEDTIKTNSEILLVDFGEKISKNFQINVNSIFDRIIPDGEVAKAFKSVALGDYNSAFDTLKQYADLPEGFDFIVNNLPMSQWPADIIEAAERLDSQRGSLFQLNVELSSYANQYDPSNGAVGFNSLPVTEAGSLPFQSSTETSSRFVSSSSKGDTWSFENIDSPDELESLFRNINRTEENAVAGAVVHWSGTFLDQNIDASWLHSIHKQRGFEGIGYHLVIKRDGTIQRGRPMNLRGAHDENNNKTFLGICFVGGINQTSKNAKKPYWRYSSSESFTPAQYKSYDIIASIFHNVFPYAQITGHYETSNEGKIDPGFDVPNYSRAKFGHQNVIPDNDPIWKASEPITINTIRQYSV